MDFNDRYKKDFNIIKNALKANGESKSEAIIAGKLGKGKTFFTDRERNKKVFTKEDLIWLHYNFGEFLENPIIKNIEVKDSMDCGVNSGLQDQDPLSFLQKIEENQRALADRINSFLKGSSGPVSESGNQSSGVKGRRQKLSGTQVKRDRADTDKENKP